MIGKQIKGTSFRGVLNYMEAKVKEGVGQQLDSNMLGTNAIELSQEFGIMRSQKPDLKKAVYHCSLAIGKEEKLSDAQFVKLGREYLEKMEFDNSQYVIYRHHDRDHPHIHIIANRINMDGQVVSDRWDYKRSEKAIRELEKKYGLSEVLSSNESKESSLSRGQVELYRRTGIVPAKRELQLILKEALVKSTSTSQFDHKLAQNGISAQYHKNSKGNVFGISFELEGQTFKGSSLGKGYSWAKINSQITNNYERNRGSDQKIDRGTPPNIRWTGKALADDQSNKHSATHRGIDADNREYSKPDYGLTARSNQFAGTTSENNQGTAGVGTTTELYRKANSEFEKSEFIVDDKTNRNSPPNRSNISSFNISNPALSAPAAGSVGNEEEKSTHKKKKKNRKRGIRR